MDCERADRRRAAVRLLIEQNRQSKRTMPAGIKRAGDAEQSQRVNDTPHGEPCLAKSKKEKYHRRGD